ncbi:MAG: hypothetical protein P8Z37_08305 [Acidobacteriota bacterium]
MGGFRVDLIVTAPSPYSKLITISVFAFSKIETLSGHNTSIWISKAKEDISDKRTETSLYPIGILIEKALHFARGNPKLSNKNPKKPKIASDLTD